MTQPFLRTPFGVSGDLTTIPNDVQVSGAVSYAQGFGPDYQLSDSDLGVLYPERPVMNELFNIIMTAVQYLQVHGFPDFITSAANGGSPYSYDKNAFVRWTDEQIYYSLADANTATPADNTKWALFNPSPPAFLTGDTILWEDTTLRTGGWVWANGQTIGNASSNATGRANSDTAALFAQIWRVFPNTIRPIVDSSGNPSTRGASAAADYAANKAIPVRDMRGNVAAGWTTMGGTTASGNLSITNGFGVDGLVFGASGGEGLGHTPTLSEMFAHSHDYYVLSGTGSGAEFASRAFGSGPQAVPTGSQGGGTAFNVVQPTTICNYITKL